MIKFSTSYANRLCVSKGSYVKGGGLHVRFATYNVHGGVVTVVCHGDHLRGRHR